MLQHKNCPNKLKRKVLRLGGVFWTGTVAGSGDTFVLSHEAPLFGDLLTRTKPEDHWGGGPHTANGYCYNIHTIVRETHIVSGLRVDFGVSCSDILDDLLDMDMYT